MQLKLLTFSEVSPVISAFKLQWKKRKHSQWAEKTEKCDGPKRTMKWRGRAHAHLFFYYCTCIQAAATQQMHQYCDYQLERGEGEWFGLLRGRKDHCFLDFWLLIPAGNSGKWVIIINKSILKVTSLVCRCHSGKICMCASFNKSLTTLYIKTKFKKLCSQLNCNLIEFLF